MTSLKQRIARWLDPPLPEAVPVSSALVASTAKVVTQPEDPPEFRRHYVTVVTTPSGRRFKVDVERYTGRFAGRSDGLGQVTQRGGKSIYFSIRRIADEIIDPELYPLVRDAVDEALRLDEQFMETPPREFTDSDGQRWIRVGNWAR